MMGRSLRALTRIMVPLSFAAGISLAAIAGTSCRALAQDVDERQEAIRGVIAAWHEAEERLDVDGVRELITADYFHVTSHGEVLDVSDLLGGMQWMRERRVTRRYERGPVTVLIHGTSAVTHYPFQYRDGGSPLEGKYVNTLVLVEESGAWKIASSHSSRIDPLAFVEVLELGTWPVVTLTPEARALYVGTYDTGSEIVRVWEEEGQLRITPGANSPLDPLFLVPMGDHTFAQGHFQDGELRRIYRPGTRISFVVEGGSVRRYELVREGKVLESGERSE